MICNFVILCLIGVGRRCGLRAWCHMLFCTLLPLIKFAFVVILSFSAITYCQKKLIESVDAFPFHQNSPMIRSNRKTKISDEFIQIARPFWRSG